MTIIFKNEAAVKKKIKNLLDKHGWFHWMPPANGFGKGGISDHNGIKSSVFLAIEAKHSSNKKGASILQREYLHDIDKAGGMAFVVDDLNIGWLDVWLQAFDNAAACVAKARGEGKNEQEQLQTGKVHNVAMFNALPELTKGWLHPDI